MTRTNHLILVCSAQLLVAGASQAAVILVEPDGSGDAPTIQAAVDQASNGDVIELADGVFTGDGNRDVAFGGKSLLVRSASGDPGACTIDCSGAPGQPHRAFLFTAGEADAAIENVTITRGYATNGGAIVYGSGSNTRIAGCVFTSNVATDSGGAIQGSPFGFIRVDSCEFRENSAESGGAVSAFWSQFESSSFHANVAARNSGAANLGDFTGCDFIANTAGEAGGASSGGTYRNCRFGLNRADSGGALAGPVVAEECWIQSNAAAKGGGIYASNPLTLTRCTIVENVASQGGGGIWGNATQLAVVQSTIAFNSSSVGSVLCLEGFSDATAEHSILAFNGPGAAFEFSHHSHMEGECNLVYGHSGGWGDWSGGTSPIFADPQFCLIAQMDNPYTVAEGSPAENGLCGQVGAWGPGCSTTVGAPEISSAHRSSIGVEPNPFRETTRLRFDVPESRTSITQLEIVDASGRRVRSLVNSRPAPGVHAVSWDGSDDHGKPVPAGAYWVRLVSGEASESERLILLR